MKRGKRWSTLVDGIELSLALNVERRVSFEKTKSIMIETQRHPESGRNLKLKVREVMHTVHVSHNDRNHATRIIIPVRATRLPN